jgi:hypothetical protein
MSTRFLTSFTLLAVLSSGCASHDSAIGNKPEAEVKHQLRASIASVQMIQDCPDPAGEAATPAAEKPMPSADESISAGASASRIAGDGGSFRQPCTQSTMQLSLAHDAPDAQRVEVVAVRLMRGTDALGPIPARKPSKWNDTGTYDAWDERVPVGSEIKVSYRLGEPDWSKVQEKLGSGVDPYAQRYVLEVDLKMEGHTFTVRSPEFSREYPHVVVT